MLNGTLSETSARFAFPGGDGVVDLEQIVRQVASTRAWDIYTPLPTSRALGSLFGISNASVCRILRRLEAGKVIWQRDNGRYYLNESRRLYERHKTYACLLRKLQAWSRVYQGIMSGFSQSFGANPSSMAFVHNDTLVQHPVMGYPPVHAGIDAQRDFLLSFFRNDKNHFEGMLLDELWLDEVLEGFPHRLTHAVVVCRPSRMPELSSVAVDSNSAALLALAHLYARGFDDVWLAIPFTKGGAVDLMAQAVVRVAAELGRPFADKQIVMAATPEDRAALVDRLRTCPRRVGIFCPEDNISVILWQAIVGAGLGCPERIGLLSGMGTRVVEDHAISSLFIDYERIGQIAGEILVSRLPRRTLLQATLNRRRTT